MAGAQQQPWQQQPFATLASTAKLPEATMFTMDLWRDMGDSDDSFSELERSWRGGGADDRSDAWFAVSEGGHAFSGHDERLRRKRAEWDLHYARIRAEFRLHGVGPFVEDKESTKRKLRQRRDERFRRKRAEWDLHYARIRAEFRLHGVEPFAKETVDAQ